MPQSRRPKPLYQRGDFRLFDGRTGLEIIWYDADRKRERSRSAGTGELIAGKAALDRLYIERTGGDSRCPTCGQARQQSIMLMSAIADYVTMSSGKASADAIVYRLQHVTDYLGETGLDAIRCDQVDEAFVTAFRKWLAARPYKRGNTAMVRAPSTVEASVHQLHAVIRGYGGVAPNFRIVQSKDVNRTPEHRSSVAELAAMFRYCIEPDGKSDRIVEQRRSERADLLAFLRLSCATWGRPDAVHDFSTAPARRQWNGERRIISLNPAGRRQTKKVRAIVPAARHIGAWLDQLNGAAIRVGSIRKAWENMRAAVGMPLDGEAGQKLIRRSMAHLVRERLPAEAWIEVEIWLGHRVFDSTSDLYAPFRPDYLRRALAALETILDEIEAAAPGAFYRGVTGAPANVVTLTRRKS